MRVPISKLDHEYGKFFFFYAMDASPTANRRDGDVRVLQDAAATVRSMRKDLDAQWVAGLRPEDELLELQRIALRRRAEAEQQNQDASGRTDGRHRAVCASKPNWLMWPLIFGVMYVIVLWARVAGLWPGGAARSSVLQGEFPPYEFHLWNVIRSAMNSSTALQGLALPSVGLTTLAALFALTTTFQFGACTQDFLCFCGFGMSTLGLFSGISSAAIFLAGCASASPDQECFTPLVTTWVSSLIRWVSPWIALWSVAKLWDSLNARRGVAGFMYPFMWRALCTVPLVGYATVVATTRWVCFRTDTTLCGEPGPIVLPPLQLEEIRHYGLLQYELEGTELLSAVVATAMLFRLMLQKPLGLVPAENFPTIMPPPAADGSSQNQDGKTKTE